MPRSFEARDASPAGPQDRLIVNIGVTPRGMTRREAASYCGLSPSTFSKYVSTGILPSATFPGKRYDRALLDQRLNALSSITEVRQQLSPLEEWRRKRGPGKY